MAKQVAFLDLIACYQKELTDIKEDSHPSANSNVINFPATLPNLVAEDISSFKGKYEISFVAIQLKTSEDATTNEMRLYDMLCRCFIQLTGYLPEHMIRIYPHEVLFREYFKEFKKQLIQQLRKLNLTDLVTEVMNMD